MVREQESAKKAKEQGIRKKYHFFSCFCLRGSKKFLVFPHANMRNAKAGVAQW